MASNERNMIERYGDGSREEGRSKSDRFEYTMQFRYTEKLLTDYVTSDSKVIEMLE